MAEPSIGGAIALQGQTNNTQRMAQGLGTALGQQAARKAKMDLYGKQKAAEEEEEIGKWFRQKGKFHRLVIPEVDKVMKEAMDQVTAIQSSNDPYASNKYARIRLDLDAKMRQIATNSDYLFKFEDNIQKLDQNRVFYGPNAPVDEFKNYFFNQAKSLEDLKGWASQNNTKLNNYFTITQEGLPVVNVKGAIPYQRDLQVKVKNLQPTIFGEEVVSIPNAYGQKELQRTLVRPLFDVDAKAAYDKNEAAYPNGMPISIEKIVKNHLEANPEIYEQASAKMNIPLTTLEDGTYNPEDLDKIEKALIYNLAEFANPELKGKIMAKPNQTTFVMPGENKPSPQTYSVAVETINQGIDTEDKTPNASKVEHISLGLSDIGVGGVTIPASEQFRNRYRRPLTGSLANSKIERLRMMPYVEINGTAGDKIKVPATKKEIDAGNAIGIYPFVEFSYSGGNIYASIDNYSNPNVFAGDKWDANMWGAVILDYKTKAAKFNKSLGGKKIKNSQELNNFVNTQLK